MNVLPHYPIILEWLNNKLKGSSPRPLIIGINAPQGAGKTTLCEYICQKIPNSVAISIDDFYLTREQQQSLAEKFPDNPYLQARGYPGTHDVALGAAVLQKLKNGVPVKIPRYDKSLHQGKGDRLPEEKWRAIDGRQDLVILEGWMLGFTPTQVSDPQLQIPNQFLASYKTWSELLDGLIHLEATPLENVIAWRIEAERQMRASGKTGLSDEAIEAYIKLFLPAYRLYVPLLKQQNRALHIALGPDRKPV